MEADSAVVEEGPVKKKPPAEKAKAKAEQPAAEAKRKAVQEKEKEKEKEQEEEETPIPEPKVGLMSSAARLHEGPREQTVTPAEEARAAPPAPAKPVAKPERPPALEPRVSFVGEREEEVVPMSPIRRRIAQRLVEAQQTAALLTTFNEIDMSEVIALREAHRDLFQQRYDVKLGFMSFFIKATVDALRLIPQVNAEIRGQNIVYRNYYDIGIAVGGGKGLVVPVLRNADQLSFAEIELAIADFGRRARENKLAVEELQGGTFTISNGGIYGSLLSTPIVNPPQSGILGLHAIQERPVARHGQVVIRPMMYVALTYDHRLVDGREAVTFLKRIKEVIEEPMRMMIEV
jgi:2-oxoglutarate dehydrogenase E2 component (dihydrolipoamide succinyltransferase)